MGNAAPLWLPIILTASLCSTVVCAFVAWRLASRSTRAPKPKPSPEATQNSDALTLAQLAVDQAALFSTLEKLTTTVKRLSSRHGMRDLRERERTEAPPVGTPKAELLRHYGFAGKAGPDFARQQLEFEHLNQGRTN